MQPDTKKFTWVPGEPAPFESSWSIFIKLMALNYLCPRDIWEVICNDSVEDIKSIPVGTRSSSWIDFEKFSQALDVHPNQLRTGFLEELGFDLRTTDVARGVKACEECLAKGYHCTFFHLELLEECPWHGVKLHELCHPISFCCKTLKKTESIGTTWHEHKELVASGINLIYKCSCAHIQFSPETLAHHTALSDDERLGILVSCNQFLKWWYTINSSDHHLAPVAHQLFSRRREGEDWHLMNSLAVAEAIAGPCPWKLAGESRPVQHSTWTLHSKEQQEHIDGSYGGEYSYVYKSIRRYLFRRYLKQHRNCWNEVRNLKNYEEQYLNSSSVCSIALAYVKWRMDMEIRTRIPEFNLPGKPSFKLRTSFRYRSRLDTSSCSVRSAANLCLISFFVILDQLEGLIDRFSITFYDTDWRQTYPEEINVVLANHSQPLTDTSIQKCTVVHPNHAYLISKGRGRCAGKIRIGDIPREYREIGSYSVFNYSPKKWVQFKIINIREQMRNPMHSFAYRCYHL